jgi:hypothetical protein
MENEINTGAVYMDDFSALPVERNSVGPDAHEDPRNIEKINDRIRTSKQ